MRAENDKISIEVQREIMKYLQYLTTEEESASALLAGQDGSRDEGDLSPAQRAAQRRQAFLRRKSSVGLNVKLSELSGYGRQLHDTIVNQFKQRNILEEQ